MGSSNREGPEEMKEPVELILGRREAAREEYKLMMHTQGPFRIVRGMSEGVSIDAHSIGMCAHGTSMHVFCAAPCQAGGLWLGLFGQLGL